MKIRNGFVSNSSSSSFILKLPFYPESVDDIKRMLLGDENPLVLTHYDDEGFPTNQVMEIIYNDVIEAIGTRKERPIETIDIEEIQIGQYSIDDYDDKVLSEYRTDYKKHKKEYLYYNDLLEKSYSTKDIDEETRRRTINAYYDKLGVIEDKMKKIIIDSIKKKTLDTDIFITLSYSDNDGSMGAFIEHGGILDPITVQRISHH